jgi:hypothetical protein
MTKEEFLKLVTPVANLVEKKSEDYQSAVDDAQGWVVKHDDYFPFGHRSFVQMIWTKCLRLMSLTGSGKAANFEGIEDTVDDMIAYLVFYRKYLQRQKKR